MTATMPDQYSTAVQRMPLQSYIRVPIAEVLRQFFCRFEPGAIIETTVRQLAEDTGLGKPAWGSITPALKRLEENGVIAYAAQRGVGTFIQRLGDDRHADQPKPSNPAPVPEKLDRVVDQLEKRKAVDRHAPCNEGARVRDPEYTMQQQQHDACSQKNVLSVVPSGWWQAFLTLDPTFSEARCHELLTKIATRHRTRHHVGSPFGLIKRHLATGEPIYSLEEIQAQAAEIAACFAPQLAAGPVPAAPERPARSGRGQREKYIQSEPATNADEEAAMRQAYVESVAPDADDDTITFLLACLDRGLSADKARTELEAAYVDG